MADRVLLTGATSGIGEATLDRLLAEGFEVLATARRETDLDRLEGAGAEPVRLDLEDEEEVAAAAEQVLEGEALDGLVHNAGIGIPGAIEDLDASAWRKQLGVNVVGPLALTHHLSGALRAAEGRIVFVSSQAALVPLPLYGAYSASKAALEAAADALRNELSGSGVEVSIIEPGPVQTGFQGRSRELLETYVDVDGSPHAQAYEGIDEAILEAGGELPVEAVVDAIVHALSANRPKARYAVGRLTHLGARIAGALPTRLQDPVLRWWMGL